MDHNNSIPRHIGLIPDGGRRWARNNETSLIDAYRKSMLLITRFIVFMFDNGVEALSVYLLSKENLRRNKDEIDAVVAAEIELLEDLLPKALNPYSASVWHAGDKSVLPQRYANSLDKICRMTSSNPSKNIYFLAGYNYLDEIKFATNNDRDSISLSRLWVPTAIDLVYRTSGENRLSGFLPLQSAYAELMFTKKHFNDVNETDLKNILIEYSLRNRRFGK